MATWSEKINERVVHRIPELGQENNVQLRQQLIEDAFSQIMIYTKANSYKREWDYILVNSVVILYNYLGTEGSTTRSVDGIRDEYGTSDILATYLSGNLPQYIRPIGYAYSDSRFDLPE